MAEGANVGTAYVSIVPSALGFGAKLQAQTIGEAALAGRKAGDALGGGLNSATAGVGKNLAGLFAAAGAGFAAVKVKAFVAESIQAASALTEQANKAGVVFGEQAGQINRFAETSANAVGLSQRAALEATGTFGNLFRAIGLGTGPAAQMSTRLVGLAADLASFNNVDPTVALDAIRSGLVGETEPLRNFGVNMNDATLKTEAFKLGLISSTSEAMSPAIKAQAAYALILAQTTTAQGDFARTSDSLANRQRQLTANMENLRAAIGQALLPAMTAATGGLTDMVGGFVALPGPLRTAATAMTFFGTAGLAVGLLAPKIRAARVELEGMGVAGTRASTALGLLGRAGGILLLMEGAVQLASQFAPKVKDLDEKVADLAATTDSKLNKAFHDTAEELSKWDAIGATSLLPKKLKTEFDTFTKVLDAGNFALAQRIILSEADLGVRGRLQSAYDTAIGSTRQLNTDQALSAKIVSGVGDAVDTTGDKIAEGAKKWDELSDALEDLIATDWSKELASNFESALNPLEKFTFSAGTNIGDLKDQVNSAKTDLDKANTDLAKLGATGTAADIARIRGQAGDIDAARTAVDQAAKRLNDTKAELAEAQKSPLTSITENLQGNLTSLTTWLANLTALSEGGHESLAKHLASLGPEAADAVAEAVGVSPKQLDKLQGLFDKADTTLADAASGAFELNLDVAGKPGETLAEIIAARYEKTLLPKFTQATLSALNIATAAILGTEGKGIPGFDEEPGPGEARRPPALSGAVVGPAVPTPITPPAAPPLINVPGFALPAAPSAAPQITIPFQVTTGANPREIAQETGDHLAWRLAPRPALVG